MDLYNIRGFIVILMLSIWGGKNDNLKRYTIKSIVLLSTQRPFSWAFKKIIGIYIYKYMYT